MNRFLHRTRTRLLLMAVVLLSVPLMAIHSQPPPVVAQTGGAYDLTWNTIDGGGGTITGGAYTLSLTIGQPDAGAVSSGAYHLAGGFWNDALALLHLYLPLISR